MMMELARDVGQEAWLVDLPGHGRAGGVEAGFLETVHMVAETIGTESVPLVGYSQGGRIAVGVAVSHPERVSHLVLVSAGIGIADPAERRRRLDEDRALADRIERDGLEAFLDEWSQIPLFSGLRRRGAEWLAADRTARLENTSVGIARALRSLGQGAQPWYGPRLGELVMPVLAIAGGDDPRYRQIAERIARAVPNGTDTIVAGAGHPLVGEVPDRIAQEIRRFLIGPEAEKRRE